MDLLREYPDDTVRAGELIARARAGQPVAVRDRRGLPLAGRLRVQAAEREALDAMTAEERIDAFWRGQLSSYQQGHWASAYPDEIPAIDDVPIWIAATLVDVCESRSLSRASAEIIVRYRRAYPKLPWG